MKRSRRILFIIAGALLTLIPSTTSALTEQSEVDVQFTFNPFLTMTLSSADIVIPNLAPGTTANSNTVNIVVNTNNVSGYNLSATVGNTTKDTRNLVHTNGTNAFSSIDVGTSATTLTTDNTWGYSIDAGSHYSGLPIYSATNGAELKNTSAPAADDTTAFLIGAKAATSQVAGDYTNVINFTAVTNALPAPTMQNLDPSLCVTSEPTTVVDSRDGEEYKVQRLADGKCWLLDNLRLDLVAKKDTLSSSNTNATDAELNYLKGTSTRNPSTDASGNFATAAVSYWTSSYSYSAPLIAIKNASDTSWNPNTTTTSYGDGSGKIGVYYNYCAASAGTYCYGDGTNAGASSGNADSDICPKGWRMPTGGPSGEYNTLYGKYNTTQTATDAASLQYNLSTPLSGYFFIGSASSQGDGGWFWSSTRGNGNSMYVLGVYLSGVSPSYLNVRDSGISLRCLLQ